MRISDWSSDVCSSDLPARLFRSHHPDYPDGGQLRDFIWVGDCVEAMLWLLDNPAVGGLFNLGTGKARSFADFARAVRQEERGVGQDGVSTSRSRWSRCH